MKKNLCIPAIIFVLLISGVQYAGAAAGEWKFDTAHSRFYFTIDHIFAKIIGFFEDFSGTFDFDPNNLAESRIEIDIKAKSLNTNIRKRDNHLRSDDFFAVSKFPLITFRSKRIMHKGGDLYEVTGDFTIKDVTQEVVLDMKYFGAKDNPLKEGEIVAGFETGISIDRLAYHVGSGKYYNMGVAGKDVALLVSLEMLRDK
jgi:polyisoprenoid-binding protein YceI